MSPDRSRPERTSEERERDRLERERRRAARAGGAPDQERTREEAEPALGVELPSQVEPESWVEPGSLEGPAPSVELPSQAEPGSRGEPASQAEQAPVWEPGSQVEPASEGGLPAEFEPMGEPSAQVEQAPQAGSAPQAEGEPPAVAEPPAGAEPSAVAEPPAGAEPIAPAPPPVGPRHQERQSQPSREYPIPNLPPPRTPPPRLGEPAARPARSRTMLARVAALVALLAVLAAVALLIRSLKHDAAKPPPGPVVVRVLIPEGKTRVQIAQIAAADGLTGDYRAAARRSPLLDPTRYGAPQGTPDLEGFLFPATYDMDKGAPVARLVEEQLEAFKENFGPEEVSAAHALHETPYQLLVVASMVEREAQVPGDRAKIAAVIYNRLKAGMPLGIDASIYYAVEMEKGIATYTHELTEEQLHIDSPYNTRTHTGLPPTPISNPGVASIKAAAHPAHVAYLYYVAGADGCGEQVFSDTQAEFEANVAAYEEAKRKNGGRPPQCKHG